MVENRTQGGITAMNVTYANQPVAAYVRRDAEFNKELAIRLHEFWAALGHKVIYKVVFDARFNIHTIKTDDLTNGIPNKERLTDAARKAIGFTL